MQFSRLRCHSGQQTARNAARNFGEQEIQGAGSERYFYGIMSMQVCFKKNASTSGEA